MVVSSTRRFLPAHHRLYLIAFLLDFSVAVGLTAMPFFIFDRLHGGAALSGTVAAFQMAIYAAGCLISAGFVSQTRHGLRWALVGVGFFAFFFTSVPWLKTPLLCGLFASLAFLGLALAWPALQSWLGGEPDPEARARHMTGFNAANAFGFTLSPLIAGPLYDIDYRLPFLLLLPLSALVAALILSLPSEAKRAHLDSARAARAVEPEPVRMTTGLLYASWGATLTANGLFAAVRSVYPKRVETLATDKTLTLLGDFRPAFLDSLGPATTYSWMAFLLSLATVVCFIILGRTKGWHGRFAPLVAGQIVAAAAFVLLGHTQSLAIMMACFIVVGANFGLCFFASMYYSLADAQAKHRRAAVNEGALGAGGFFGGIGFGFAAESAGITAAFQWAPAFVAVALAAQLLLLRVSGRCKRIY